MKPRILVVSSVNMDFVMKMSKLPQSGQTLIERGGSYSFVPGGKGANSALAFSNLGGDCVLCARIGNDAHGATALSQLKKAGVDTRFVIADKYSETGLAAVTLEEDGANRIVVYPGANASLCPSDIEEAFTCRPDAAYLQFEIPDDAVVAASKCAQEQGIPTFIDAAPARRDFPFDKLAPVEIFSPNETETYTYTGIMPNNSENCLRAAVKLGSMVKAKYYVIKLGARGAYIYDGRYSNIIPAPEVKAVDTTAAGDAFTSALTLHYLYSKDIVESCRFANLAGALTATRFGAGISVPSLDELEEFAKEIGYDA